MNTETKSARALIDWPSEQSIRKSALRAMMEMEGEKGLDPEEWLDTPVLDDEQIEQLAPSMQAALSKMMDEYDMPDSLLEQLDRENEYLAQVIASQTTPKERRELVQAANAAREK